MSNRIILFIKYSIFLITSIKEMSDSAIGEPNNRGVPIVHRILGGDEV